ncbi:hypothetical protein D9615_003095 [Tricholomella constricta]|uniref:Uncharacterized protein n=1 Tax=Tricholomella constricta TaxID=117010 RepID=A0A8H5HIV2_9AGAR|nr:hypothetical protein D9615_003095 [Tricholomella constricta]
MWRSTKTLLWRPWNNCIKPSLTQAAHSIGSKWHSMAMTYLPLIIGLKAAQKYFDMIPVQMELKLISHGTIIPDMEDIPEIPDDFSVTSVEQGSLNALPRYPGIHCDDSRRLLVSEPPSYTETDGAQADRQHLAGPSTSRQPHATQSPFASSTATNDYARRQTSVGGSSTSSNSSYVTARSRLTESAHGHTAESGNRDSRFSTTSDETGSSSWSISPNASNSNSTLTSTVAEY